MRLLIATLISLIAVAAHAAQIDGSQLAPGTVGPTQLAPGAAAANLGNASVTNAKLASSSVTVNGQTCVLGSGCTIPSPTNGAAYAPLATTFGSP